MKNIVKKTIIVALVGIMQVGIGAATIEASPRYDNAQRYESRDNRHDSDREQKIRAEKERHEREMKRHPGESDREWRDRQDREKAHHEEVMRTLGALAVLAVVLHNQ